MTQLNTNSIIVKILKHKKNIQNMFSNVSGLNLAHYKLICHTSNYTERYKKVLHGNICTYGCSLSCSNTWSIPGSMWQLVEGLSSVFSTTLRLGSNPSHQECQYVGPRQLPGPRWFHSGRPLGGGIASYVLCLRAKRSSIASLTPIAALDLSHIKDHNFSSFYKSSSETSRG